LELARLVAGVGAALERRNDDDANRQRRNLAARRRCDRR
jgi:hypothetical protein